MIYPEVKLSGKQFTAYQLLTDNKIDFLLYGGGAGGGKTYLGCVWLVLMCYNYPGTRYYVGRKELKRLMNSVYITFLKVFKDLKVPESDWKLNGQYNYIEFANGSRIDLLDVNEVPSDPLFERFGSLEYTGGWLEEAGEISHMAFDVLKSRVGRHKNNEYNIRAKTFITCNPTQNWLYRVFYKNWATNQLPEGYAFIRALYTDNPHTAETYGRQLEQIDDPVLRARLKDGLWEYSFDDLVLMDYDSIISIFTNDLPVQEAQRYLTSDVARFGDDRITIGSWIGYDLYKLDIFNKQSLERTKEQIRDTMLKENIPYDNCVIDEDGLGAGVVDALNGVHGFMGGRSAILKPDDNVQDTVLRYENLPASYLKKPNYKNLRSQCYFLLADKVNKKQIKVSADIPSVVREQLVEELQQIKREDTVADAPLQIVGKDSIKESIGRSPDLADTLAMRMFFDLIVPTNEGKFFMPDIEYLQKHGVEHINGGIDWM